jgi:DNA-directed RNA polymerase subunit RPC12/RpoP
MAKVVKGTAEAKKVGIVKTNHAAGTGKIRCPGCKAGYAVLTETNQGKVYHCSRCGRQFAAGSF